MRSFRFCFFLIFALQSSLLADSSVWKVESADSTLYLGGTVHILRDKDYPLPPEFTLAYELTDTLVLEIDPGAMNPMEMRKYIWTHGIYTDGKTLETVLSPEAYKQLEEYSKGTGMSMTMLKRFKPSIAILFIMGSKMKQSGVGGGSTGNGGVDKYFYQRGMVEGRNVSGLETAQEQLEMIIAMGEGQENDYVLNSLRDLDSIEESLDSIISHWRSGDEEKLYSDHVEKLQTEYPALYKSMLVDRNNKWIPRIEEHLKTKEKEFILVGAAHLVGPDGLIEILRKKGYRVDKFVVPGTKPDEAAKPDGEEPSQSGGVPFDIEPQRKPDMNETGEKSPSDPKMEEQGDAEEETE